MATARNYSNTASQAQLSAAIASTDTSITLTGFTGYPAAPFTAAIARGTANEEIVLVTAVSSNTVTVTRGYDSTTAKAQGAGSTFQEVAVALDFRDANSHVVATTGVHGVTGAVVGTTDVQTLTNKTLTSPTISGPTQTGTSTIATASVTTLTVTGVSTLAGLSATTGSFSSTLAVTGVSTLTGQLNANGGIAATTITASGLVTVNGSLTVPTGKIITITDAPVATTAAANKGYVDGLFTAPPASRKLSVSQGTGVAFPASNLLQGDTFLRTDLGTNGSLWVYSGQASLGSSGWLPEGPITCTSATRPTAALFGGLEIYETDTGRTYAYLPSGLTIDGAATTTALWDQVAGPPEQIAFTLAGTAYKLPAAGGSYRPAVIMKRGRDCWFEGQILQNGASSQVASASSQFTTLPATVTPTQGVQAAIGYYSGSGFPAAVGIVLTDGTAYVNPSVSSSASWSFDLTGLKWRTNK